jgi:hypothetical protein
MWFAFLENFNENGTCRQPEHGKRNRHEREVIPHGDAEDSRQE